MGQGHNQRPKQMVFETSNVDTHIHSSLSFLCQPSPPARSGQVHVHVHVRIHSLFPLLFPFSLQISPSSKSHRHSSSLSHSFQSIQFTSQQKLNKNVDDSTSNAVLSAGNTFYFNHFHIYVSMSRLAILFGFDRFICDFLAEDVVRVAEFIYCC